MFIFHQHLTNHIMENLLAEHNIPSYLASLLSLAGVFNSADLGEVNDELLNLIEAKIRAGSFADQVDFKSKQNRLKYFGSDYSDLTSFSFRALDRMKLTRLAEQLTVQRKELGLIK